MSSFSKFTFYYIFPVCMGFSLGIIVRDYHTVNINKKLSMSLAEYYQNIEEEPSENINRHFPEVKKLLKRINERNEFK